MSDYKVGQKARIHWPSGWHGDVEGVIVALNDGVQHLEVRDEHNHQAWWELSWEDDREVILLDQPAESDPVNSPSHYTAYKGLEIIDLTEQMNFNRGNAVKYIARAGLKNPDHEIEDLEKAAWYINREIARLKPPELPCGNCQHAKSEHTLMGDGCARVTCSCSEWGF
jgi:hypothetical protein